MASPTTPPVPSGYGDDDPDAPSRSRLALTATLVAVSVLISGWIYVLFIYDPGLMIDELADPTFPTAAEQVCAAAVTRLDQLPSADQATSAFDRADAVEQSNLILSQMVADLRPLAPTEPPETAGLPAAALTEDQRTARAVADGVAEWLDDWATYIGDRRDYVENLREDDQARFLETTKGSDTKGITRAISSFAQVNRMESCETPADVS